MLVLTVEFQEKKKMIKRQFYHIEHANKDDASDSSSSSDSELEAEEIEESEDDAVPEVQENNECCSTSSGLFILISFSLSLSLSLSLDINWFLVSARVLTSKRTRTGLHSQ